MTDEAPGATVEKEVVRRAGVLVRKLLLLHPAIGEVKVARLESEEEDTLLRRHADSNIVSQLYYMKAKSCRLRLKYIMLLLFHLIVLHTNYQMVLPTKLR